MLTHVPETGKVDDSGGCKACLSPAPMENRTCGPPGGGIYFFNQAILFLGVFLWV